MNLQSYYKIKEFLEQERATKEEHRAFALKHKITSLPKYKQLLFWFEKHTPNTIFTYSYSSTAKNILLIIAFVLGFLSAITLLSYSGDKPVNIIYFFALAVVLPLISMFLSLLALLWPKHLTPLFLTTWLEKLIAKISEKSHRTIAFDTTLQASYSLFLVQFSSLLFSIGLLIGFFLTILTHDIAFGWSTTLQISAKAFYEFLHTLSFAFTEFCPQSVISLELVEKSHYFRLGQSISAEMQNNAALFGEWWKFLACSTLFYAIFLRLIFLFVAYNKFQKSLKQSLLHLPKAQQLLEDMNEPIITTQSQEDEVVYKKPTGDVANTKKQEKSYSTLLGWTFTDEELLLTIDALQLEAKEHFSLGGAKTLQEDTQTITKLQKNTLLLVKAWEIPTMEFIDILQEIAHHSDHVTLSLLGYAKNAYKANKKDITVWEEKIAAQNLKNVSIKL